MGASRIFANTNAVQALPPSLVLIFGPFDPTGASSLPADAVTCASLGCHALSAITALRVQDTAHIDETQAVSPEFLDDQARCLLEDMAVQAIKVGQIYTTETVSVVAQIAADYNDVPLILHLQPLSDTTLMDAFDAEEVHTALFELLLPLTDLVIVDHSLLAQWQAEGILTSPAGATPGQSLLQYGASWVLSCGSPSKAEKPVYLLEGQQGESAHWPWQRPTARLQDPEGPLSCAITSLLAVGTNSMVKTIEHAIALAKPITGRHFQPGMGQRLVLRGPLPR